MAEEARRDGILGDRFFIVSVWALLLCTLASPLLMRYALHRKLRSERATARSSAESSLAEDSLQEELGGPDPMAVYTVLDSPATRLTEGLVRTSTV